MIISVRIVSGYNSPQLLEFDKKTITIGRSSSADVRLHATKDVVCARGIHARLVCEGDEWFVVIEHDNGLLVRSDGLTPLQLQKGERHQLGMESEITVGANGPMLRVITSSPGTAVLPDTIPKGRACGEPPIAGVPGDVVVSARRAGPRLAGVAAVLLVLIGVVAFASYRQVGNLRATILNTRTEISRELQDQLATHLNRAEESVYLVAVKDEAGNVSPEGTAWAIAAGVLATNAHVAEGVAGRLESAVASPGKAKNKFTVVARSTGRNPRDLPVERIDIHPGYPVWSKMMTTLRTKGEATEQERVRLLSSVCDVGLLYVNGDVGRPLELASRQELLEIRPGDEIGYVGFPLENVPGLHKNPPPALLVGRITAVTDFFLQCAATDNCYLLQHNAVTAGGSSGSPLLNKAGHVIGVHSAGSFVFTSGGRAPVGLNFAQRADLIQELVKGDAQSAQDDRHKKWMAGLDKSLDADLDAIADTEAQMDLELLKYQHVVGRSARLAKVAEYTKVLPPGRDDDIHVAMNLEADEAYGFFAIAENWSNIDMSLLALRLGGLREQVLARNEEPDSLPSVWTQLGEPAEVEIRISCPHARSAPTQVYILVVRISE